ncbi:TIGR01777 family oxidoreductase [Wenyingzhuangia sp. 1_MG-2023]|nr:TIGR01777 family oxidoreductase [Wenyingzhuangia sp. 1_MG-2023]
MRVLITGGTGLIGSYLQELLLAKNMEVIVLSRSAKVSNTKGLLFAKWDIDNKVLDEETICSADCIVHLAGAGIADKRWTDAQKQIIIDSRVKSANLLYETLSENEHQVKSIVSASGVNYYGTKTTNQVFNEKDALGDDFLAKVCQVWEQSVLQFDKLGIRTVSLRTGVVFAKEKSALQKMSKPIQLGVGSAIGSGKQIMPIIHIQDLCQMYIKAILDTDLQGVYNAVSVNPTNNNVTQEIAKKAKKPLWIPKVPAFVLHLIFGKMASILLEGSAISNEKIKNTGFEFQYSNLTQIIEASL